MSDINLDFTVSNNEITFTVAPNEITFTPSDVQLTVTTGTLPVASATQGQLLYYNTGIITGIPTANYLAGNLNLGNVANIKIDGGVNGYVLQTDGTGNLDWVAQSGGGGGNGTPGGSNTQVQYNDSGSFGGNVGFTFNEVTGVFTAPFHAGNANGLFSINGSNVTGTVANATYATNAGFAASATIASTVTTAAQPNITSTGTLTGLTVDGNVSISDTVSIYQAVENVAIIGAQTGTYNYNLLDGAIQYSTANATGNLTLNFRGNSTVTMNSFLSTGQSTIGTYLLTTGTAPYGVTAVQIDGVSQTINWASGAVPTQYSNTTTSYTFTMIKTGSATYKILGAGTRYN